MPAMTGQAKIEGKSPLAAAGRQKVVLYNPKAVFFTMPLGLLAVASELDPERYDAVIIDGRLEKDPIAAVLAQLDGALCLGVSVLTGAPIRDALAITRAAKAARPDLPIVWGGWHPSLFGEECLEEPSVDITVQAQGEETFREIVERLERDETMEGCQGCAYRTPDGLVRKNPARTMRDLNRLARHNFELLPIERYYELKGARQFDYVTSQGCNFRCAFCADPFVYGRKWSGLGAERIGEEIEALWQRYRFDDLNFQDENYFTRADRVEAIADEFIRRKLPITWAATMRADQGDRLSEQAMSKCKESGLRRVLIGVESGSQEMMDWMKKDIKLEQVFSAAEKCLRHGIAVIFPFIVGFPNETDASVRASLDVARRLREMSPSFQTQIFYFKPYPGSPISDDAVANGYPLPATLDGWAEFDYVGSSGPWVSAERQRWVERFKFYQRVGYGLPSRGLTLLQKLARWRCEREVFALPIEKVIFERFRPQVALS